MPDESASASRSVAGADTRTARGAARTRGGSIATDWRARGGRIAGTSAARPSRGRRSACARVRAATELVRSDVDDADLDPALSARWMNVLRRRREREPLAQAGVAPGIDARGA
jgi:hypothetical protein